MYGFSDSTQFRSVPELIDYYRLALPIVHCMYRHNSKSNNNNEVTLLYCVGKFLYLSITQNLM